MPIIGNFGGGSSKVDKTLLMEGVAADAKATGEAIEAVKTMYVTAEFGEEISSSGASSLHTLVNVSSTPEEIINAHKNGVRVVLEHPDAGYFDVTMIDEDKLRVLFQGTYDSAELQITLRYSGDAVMCSVTKTDIQYIITGTPGQIVGFDENGNAVAQNIQGGGTIDEDTLANLELITLEDIDEICYVIPPNTFQKVRSLQDGKKYVLLFGYNGTYYCVGNEAFNDWTVKAYSVPEVISTDEQITFTTVPTLFTAMASGDGFILNNGSSSITGEASSGGTSLKVNDSAGTIFSVDTSAMGGFDNDEIIAKADDDAIWLRAMLNEQNCCLKFEVANTSIGIDYKDRNETYSTGFLSFVLYEKIS